MLITLPDGLNPVPHDQIRCVDAVEGMRSLPDDSIPMTLTSPPYDHIRRYGGHSFDFKTFKVMAEELYRVTRPGGILVWVVADAIINGGETGTSARQKTYFKKIGFRIHQTIIMARAASRWPSQVRHGDPLEYAFVLSKGRPRSINLRRDRPNTNAGARYRGRLQQMVDRGRPRTTDRPVADWGVRTAVWTYPVGSNRTTKDRYAYEHPALMPEAMAKDHILSWSRPGDMIFDPMCGAGTTPKMALLNDRRYLGFEVHEPYHRIALRRMRDAHAENRRRLGDWLITRPEDRAVGPNSVVHGDCFDLIPRLPERSVNLVVTSPPYAQQRNDHYPGVPEEDYPEFTVEWMAALWNKLADDGSVLIILDPHVDGGVLSDYVLQTRLALRDFGWKEHRPQIWFKPDMMPLGHKWWPRHCYEEVLWFSKGRRPYCDPWATGRQSGRLAVGGYQWSEWSNGRTGQKAGVARASDVIVVPVGANEQGVDHPARFPVPLAESLIQTFCPEGGVVLDPFCGSGSSLVAAAKLGRSYYGFDLVADYCELTRRRLNEVDNAGPLKVVG